MSPEGQRPPIEEFLDAKERTIWPAGRPEGVARFSGGWCWFKGDGCYALVVGYCNCGGANCARGFYIGDVVRIEILPA